MAVRYLLSLPAATQSSYSLSDLSTFVWIALRSRVVTLPREVLLFFLCPRGVIIRRVDDTAAGSRQRRIQSHYAVTGGPSWSPKNNPHLASTPKKSSHGRHNGHGERKMRPQPLVDNMRMLNFVHGNVLRSFMLLFLETGSENGRKVPD